MIHLVWSRTQRAW